MLSKPDMRRQVLSSGPRLGAVMVSAALLAACNTMGTGGPSSDTATTPAPVTGQTIGTGTKRVALLVPLSGAAGGVGFRNAAEMALHDSGNVDLQILVKDTGGTAEGAQAAAEAAVREGAKLAIGPLYAQGVQAAGQVTRRAGIPMIAFSTDPNVATRGIYLLSFLADASVDRVVQHAAQTGRKSFAALVPSTSYGMLVEAAFKQAVARHGGRIAGIERLTGDAAADKAAAARIAQLATHPQTRVDALFLPEGGQMLRSTLDGLQAAGLNTQRVKLLGTGVWDEAQTLADPRLQGGWFAGPAPQGYKTFAQRYKQAYGLAPPLRMVTLAYDATRLAAELAKAGAITDQALLNPNGFAGVDGIFRFRSDGRNDRGLAVLEVKGGSVAVASPPPSTFQTQVAAQAAPAQ